MKKSEITRQYLLEKAFDLIYANGYQATSIDKIIETTSVTKGAFFYHFKNKEEMGLAVIKEVIAPRFEQSLITPVVDSKQPVQKIYETIETFMLNISDEQVINGCPTNNLIQEMSPVNPKFMVALKGILEKWKHTMAQVLQKAADRKEIEQHNFEEVATFIVCSYEGTRGIGKIHQSKDFYQLFLRQLKTYLSHL
ncbi:MAG: TetR/AcrR family transcriptional regulator [Cytophagales bacterium]|nr:TetR/AcrR family transcriptional regulator [Cytophagales bacterium]